MMTANTFVFNKDIFINTPPHFDGEKFELWKEIFDIFIKVTYFET